ncbi:unnamed protein product [Peniophora sp. CBMAI 1063]|nr:unnamed protein product [Peniophora sp. CBMAI 1063]
MARRASVRASTRAESPPLTKDDLSTRECLVLAQAVFELGGHEWHKVVQILNGHSLIQRPESAFTPQSTEAIWRAMMTDAGVQFEADLEKKKNLPSRRLAHVWHQRRMAELKDHIAAEETRFKTIAAEIVAIRSGAWDEKIKAMVEPVPAPAQDEAQSEAEDAETPSSAEPRQFTAHTPPATPSASPNLKTPSTPLRHALEASQKHIDEPAEPLTPAEGDSVDVIMTIGDEHPSVHASLPDVLRSTKSALLQDAQDSISDESDAIERSAEQPASDEEPAPQLSGAEDDETEDMREEKETSPDIPLQQQTPVPERRITRQGKRRASEAASELSESVRDRKKQRETSAADEDSDEDPVTAKRRAQDAAKKFERVIMMLHADISNHRNGAIFQNPIKPSEAPDYHEIVKRPMDLKTMKARIKSGQISTSTEFQRDIYLMFANSMMYNKPNSDIYGMAGEMMMEAEKKIQEFRQTEVLRGG